MMVGAAAAAFVSPSRVRAIVSDVDGTLFPFGTSQLLSPANTAALQGAMNVGCHVGLATGRIPGPWSDKVRQQLPGLGPSVFGNGALVTGANQSVAVAHTLSRAAVSAVTEFSRGARAAGAGRPRAGEQRTEACIAGAGGRRGRAA